jgi:HlyD family secretion protein
VTKGLARIVVTLVVLASVASAAVLARRSRSFAAGLPTAVVQKTAFVDYLQVRGEIRPVRSTIMTAPSSGVDMQILQLVTNGASVSPGDVVVQFDTTTQQRTLEQKRSELKQADSEIARAEAEGARRLQAAEAELSQARSAAERARLDTGGADLVARVEAEKRALLFSNAEHQVRGLQEKVEGERAAAAAEVALQRQKRNKAQYDVEETERIIAALTVRAPAAGAISLLPNFRAGGPFNRAAPEFRRGDRVWFGAPIAELPDLSSIPMTCRLDEADRARVGPGTRVLIRVDAVPDRELPASIRDISAVARPDFSSFPPVRNFDAIVALGESDPRLRSGMSASARIELNRLDNAIVVPSGAVFQVNGATTVYVVKGAEITPQPVTVLRRGRDQIAIASGVQEGERVALRDPNTVNTR